LDKKSDENRNTDGSNPKIMDEMRKRVEKLIRRVIRIGGSKELHQRPKKNDENV